jgi:acyl-coenzyme A synthetase/AMP-(fatty) acid ligase
VTLRALVDGIQAELAANDPNFGLIVEDIPPLDAIYPKLGKEKADDPFEQYPQPAIRPPMTDVLLYLHSSGSTGFPKAIPQTYQILTYWSTSRKFSNPPSLSCFANY